MAALMIDRRPAELMRYIGRAEEEKNVLPRDL